MPKCQNIKWDILSDFQTICTADFQIPKIISFFNFQYLGQRDLSEGIVWIFEWNSTGSSFEWNSVPALWCQKGPGDYQQVRKRQWMCGTSSHFQRWAYQLPYVWRKCTSFSRQTRYSPGMYGQTVLPDRSDTIPLK